MRDDPAVLSIDGRTVAEYVWRPELPTAMSPRPFLHPVSTLSGVPVTELMPTSHRHHLGASIAIADVDGHNFWGSRTFVPGHGPAWLNNHGTQEHVRWIRRTPDELCHALRWMSTDREQLLTERRTWAAQPVDPHVWALTCEFALTNTSGRTLRIQSPAGLGRPGAGFGGFFWHASSGPVECHTMTATAGDTEAVNGSPAPWIAVSGLAKDGLAEAGLAEAGLAEAGPAEAGLANDGPAAEQRWWTLVFVAASPETREDPWFLRTRDYIGIGSALSWDDPLLLDPDAVLTRRIVVLVADGRLTSADAGKLAAGFPA